MESVQSDFAKFLDPKAKEELKTAAVENALGLTGTNDGKTFLMDSDQLVAGLLSLTEDNREDIKEMVFKSLINLAVDEEAALKMLTLKNFENMCVSWMKNILDQSFTMANLVCKLVSNLTRHEKGAKIVARKILQSREVSIDRVVIVLTNLAYNDKADLHYLAAILSNLSQEREIRKQIMDKDLCIIQRLLPFTEFRASKVRRTGIVGTLKNCCFDSEFHEWLLSDEVDLLPRLLLPLAGPEEFEDDDMERLPDDLQYLPPDKQREPEPEIRKMLCEAILQLCATKTGKKIVKDKNAYVIMREYFKWESKREPVNEIAAMNVIDILIGDEPKEEFGDNLKDVEIPEDLEKQFVEDDKKEYELAIKEKQDKHLS